MAVAAFRQVDVEFRVEMLCGRLFNTSDGLSKADRISEACAGIHTVVEAVPAFFKENVAAHFAGNQCAGFFHGGFDEAVAGFPSQVRRRVL